MNSAAKVGVLLVVFVGLLLGAYVIVGKSLFQPPADLYFVTLPDAAGVTPGSQVLMAGVQVGSVAKIELKDAKTASMTLAIKNGTVLPTGTTVRIPTSFVGLGTPIVELVPDSVNATPLQPGATLLGRKGSPLDGIMPDGGKQTFEELNKTLVAFQKLLAPGGITTDLQNLLKTTDKTIATSQTTLKNFAALAGSANGMLTRNQANLDAMILSTRKTLEDVNTSAHAFAVYMKEGKLQNQTNALLEKANTIASQASGLMASMDKLMSDPELQANIKKMTKGFADTSERGPAIADNAKQITENMAVITDRSKDIPLKLAEIMDKASKLEDQLSEMMGKVGGILGKKPSAGALDNMVTTMDLIRESNPGHWRTDFTTSFPLNDGKLYLGMYDAFEGNKLTVQLGKDIGKGLGYRYGIFASKPGLGVNYRLDSRTSLRTDLWNLNDPRLDGRLRYDFGKGLVGWLGMNSIFNQNSATIGIGIQR